MDEEYESEFEDAETGALRAFTRGPLAGAAEAEPRTVGELVRALSAMYPERDAEEWDRTGLLVGDASEPLSGVAVVLDPTVAGVREAAEAGANVLITHHPAFLDAPSFFGPATRRPEDGGAVVYEAVKRGVALANWHTALDVSAAAQEMLPGMLRLSRVGVLEPLAHDDGRGYGQVCSAEADGAEQGSGLTLGRLAARCTATFHRAPRVWGDMDKPVRTAVTWTGAAGDAMQRCLERGVDVLICGEAKYHAALAAANAGLSIIELGHDVSEEPFAKVLAASAARAGVPHGKIAFVDVRERWAYPETRRV